MGQEEEEPTHTTSPWFSQAPQQETITHGSPAVCSFLFLDGVSQFHRMLRAVHWHQTWGIVVSWLWKRLSVHWAWGSSFKHELPGNPRVSGCLNRTVGKVIIGGFNLDKGRLSRCYREIGNQTVPSCPLMLFRVKNGIGGNMAKWGRPLLSRSMQAQKSCCHHVKPRPIKQFMHRLL